MEETCFWCEGTCKEFPDCGQCDGSGWVDDPSNAGTMTCPDCHNDACSTCEGQGYIEIEEDEDEIDEE